MRRRRAIKNIGLGLSAGLVLPVIPGWLSACKEDEPGPEIQYDGVVAVIGAGAAGLYAADILKSKGLQVRIFEASDRIGGRIRSLRLFDDAPVKTDFPIEMGAERIIGSDSLWAGIIDQLNIPVVDITTSATDNFILDNVYREDASVQTDPDFVAAKNFLNNISTYAGSDVSVQTAIDAAGINTRTHKILNSWIGNKYGTSNSRLSIKALAEALNMSTRNSNESVLKSNPMQDVLTSRFSAIAPVVELNTVIKAVDYSSDKIKLTGEKTSSGGVENISVDVDKVVIAVPVSVLKAGAISFLPALPAAKLAAMNNIGMDASIRVVFDFKQNFWGKSTGFIYGGTKSPELFSSGISRSEFNKTLSITVNGQQAEELSAMGPDSISQILAELDSAFQGKATLNVRRDEQEEIIYEFMDWSKAPFIKGGYSYLKPGGLNENRVSLAEPLENLLFFAGEATDVTGEAGTISGALHSAERATEELIVSILNP